VRSELPFVVQRSAGIVAAVGGAIGPVSSAGLAVALLLVAAAGSYWVDRRRREVTLLAAKGVGPAAIALKAGLEMAPPAAAGALAGWALAILLVTAFGPSDLLDAAAPWAALARVGIGLAAGSGCSAWWRPCACGHGPSGASARAPAGSAGCRSSWRCWRWRRWRSCGSRPTGRRSPAAPACRASTCCCWPFRCCS
jgi:putative ABC transport system permease protein